jgi:hypothetical protein
LSCNLPAPLVPLDTDLRDYPSILLDIDRLLNSDFNTIADDRAWRAGVTLWLKSFRQLPASSLPSDDASLAGLAGYGREMKAWAKAKPNVMRHWILCSDGRYYHPVVSEKALEAWIDRLLQRKASGAGNQKQWGAAFDEASLQAQIDEAVMMLAALNPQSRIFKKKGKKLLPGTPTGTPTGNPSGMPDGSPTGTENPSHRDSHRDAKSIPPGVPQGVPQGIPVRSQAKAEAKASKIEPKQEVDSEREIGARTSHAHEHTHTRGHTHTRETPTLDRDWGDDEPMTAAGAAPNLTRATRLPRDWVPNAAERDFAATAGFAAVEIDRMADTFRDHFLAKGGQDATKLDWTATWRNWVRRERKPSGGQHPGGQHPGAPPSRPTRGVASALAGVDAYFDATGED